MESRLQIYIFCAILTATFTVVSGRPNGPLGLLQPSSITQTLTPIISELPASTMYEIKPHLKELENIAEKNPMGEMFKDMAELCNTHSSRSELNTEVKNERKENANIKQTISKTKSPIHKTKSLKDRKGEKIDDKRKRDLPAKTKQYEADKNGRRLATNGNQNDQDDVTSKAAKKRSSKARPKSPKKPESNDIDQRMGTLTV